MGDVPRPKRLQVAAEFGFRCALCRAPSYQIHHIIEQEHGGPDDLDNLIPLCPTHHLEYLHREKLIEKPELVSLKHNPPGLSDCEGLFPGPLANQRIVIVGGCGLIDCHPIISYSDVPILDIVSGSADKAHLHLYCEDEYRQPVIQIEDGEWVLGKGAFRFTTNPYRIIILDDRHVEELLRIELDQKSSVALTGRFHVDGHFVEISPAEFRVDGIRASGTSLVGGAGFRIMTDGIVLL